MLKLEEGTPLDMLRQFSVDLGGDLFENIGASRMELNNNVGEGSISLFEVLPGITAWIYDIQFEDEYAIDMKFAQESLFYFGYHVSGQQMTKFASEFEYNTIRKGQIFILSGKKGSTAEFVIPEKTKYKCCYLIVDLDLLKQNSTRTKYQLEIYLEEILRTKKADSNYRYFGDIDVKTGLFAEIIVSNKRTDVVGRLITEAAIFNMLATQIEAHDDDLKIESKQPTLMKSELAKIAELGDYVKDNIANKHSITELSKHLGLNPKKLQSGSQFLFGHSMNRYIANLKLEHARELLQTTNLNISQVCYSIGYSSRSFFSKQFKERYGMLPSDYKNSFFKDNILFEVSYRSLASSDLKNEDISDIVQISRAQNEKYGITGSLIYYRRVFFQIIEGPKKDILRLYESIKTDKRHVDVKTMWQGPKAEREFSKWHMALLSNEPEVKIQDSSKVIDLNLNHLMGDVEDKSSTSENLWRKVRNVLKVANSN